MNQENLKFLQNGLEYLGFPENILLGEHLEEQIGRQSPEVQLYTEAQFNKEQKLETILHFSRSTKTDMYFFNRYQAKLVHPENSSGAREQIFYINKGSGFSFKESFNLLCGRSVYKKLTDREGRPYVAWVKLNFEEREASGNYKFRRFGHSYGYDLEKILAAFSIGEWKNADSRFDLIRSLQKGNLQLVHLERNGQYEKMYIEAEPMFKTINIYPAVPEYAE